MFSPRIWPQLFPAAVTSYVEKQLITMEHVVLWVPQPANWRRRVRVPRPHCTTVISYSISRRTSVALTSDSRGASYDSLPAIFQKRSPDFGKRLRKSFRVDSLLQGQSTLSAAGNYQSAHALRIMKLYGEQRPCSSGDTEVQLGLLSLSHALLSPRIIIFHHLYS